MHIVLVSIGTDGDVFPYVGLGKRLRAVGHNVTLVASGHYEALALDQQFGFKELMSTEEDRELFGHPDFWHPRKTIRLSARWGVRFLKRQFELLADVTFGENAVLVASPAVFAAGLVHEKFGTPYVSLILQPGLIPSSIRPPVMPGFTFLRHAPRSVWKLFWRALDLVGDWLVGRELNRLRGQLGLKSRRRLFRNWLSPQLALGMFPEWYGPPQADWPPQLRLAGFPMFDGEQRVELPLELAEFCAVGPPPVVFTFGTGMRHSAALFRTALEACRLGGIRGVLLTNYRDQLPAVLPSSVVHCEFASFKQLFPRCATVVHHGGIGTVASALATAIPQLIVPICFDQIDNGTRVRALGVGDWLNSQHRRANDIVNTLRNITTVRTKERCRAVARRLETVDALTTAAEQIEQFSIHNRSHPRASVSTSQHQAYAPARQSGQVSTRLDLGSS